MQQLTPSLALRQLTQLESSTPELLPPELRNFQLPFLTPEWCWIVEHNGQPISLIVTSPVHGIVFIWRILATSSAQRALYHILASLPAILDTCKQRGCVG